MLINLTPHDIVVECGDGSRHTIAKSGDVARVTQTNTPTNVGVIVENGVAAELYTKEYGNLVFPAVPENTYVIVSALAQNACVELCKRLHSPFIATNGGGRVELRHVLAPGEPIRDESGAIVACRGFVAVTL